jgi:hypothetical protein
VTAIVGDVMAFDPEPNAAVMFVVPGATPVNNPPLLIVATFVADEVHVTNAVMSTVVPSAKVAVAVNCCVAPTATDAGGRLTEMDVIGAEAAKTETGVDEVPPDAAVTVVGPVATKVNSPEALMVALLVSEDVHVAVDETSFVVPSLIVAVAVNCSGVPFTTSAPLAGLIAIDLIVGVVPPAEDVTVTAAVALTMFEPEP